MATAANMEAIPQPITLHVRRLDAATGEIFETPHTLPFGQAMRVIIEQYSQPNQYQRGQTGRTDRGVMLALLDRMRTLGRVDAVKFDIRSMGSAANIHHNTSMKALRRLGQEYGFVELCDGGSWFDHDLGYELTEADHHTVNMFNAYAYRLTTPGLTVDSEVFQIVTDILKSALDTVCHNSAHLDTDTLNQYADCDAFAWGARESGDPDSESLGKAALDLIAALVANNDLGYADIAEVTGMSRSTASKKARALAALGIVEIYREGRSMVVYLVSDWREILDRLLSRLTTYCRNVRRKIGHLQERIKRVSSVIIGRDITSGLLESALRGLLESWQRKLELLRTDLTAKTRRGLSLTQLRNGQAENTALDTGADLSKLDRLCALTTIAATDSTTRVVRLAA
ncbi:MAG: hypothetical protein KDE31_15895 [Caldilineaceae bacterium]|nr:hypothetical protein [Caldilineaceae bacterium]